MHQRGDMMFARYLSRRRVGFYQRGIIPAAYLIQFISMRAIRLGAWLTLKALQDLVNVFLDHLELVGDGNPIPIVIDRDDRRRLQHTDRIDRFPEHALRGGGVANARKGDLVPVLRELSKVF